ncbi:hypothetical protein [Streptococcus sp. Marseille-P7376]|uniref:hypothetical protein n=1 Tax=Streptococcus sp. Marseille-P7376 TaxID=2592044 RepID=UPI0011E7B717|nr:hypothetical protein [Streptococcus sp. Marseille-P7376]
MDLEKMIVVKKSTKWWMTVVASASLAVGAVGGYGIGALTQRSPQQSSVQATMPQQKNQEGKMPGQGGQPPQGQGQGNENGMPPQMGGQNGPGGQLPQENGQQGGSQQENKSKTKPSNADGTTKDDKSSETIENNSKTTNS